MKWNGYLYWFYWQELFTFKRIFLKKIIYLRQTSCSSKSESIFHTNSTSWFLNKNTVKTCFEKFIQKNQNINTNSNRFSEPFTLPIGCILLGDFPLMTFVKVLGAFWRLSFERLTERSVGRFRFFIVTLHPSVSARFPIQLFDVGVFRIGQCVAGALSFDRASLFQKLCELFGRREHRF